MPSSNSEWKPTSNVLNANLVAKYDYSTYLTEMAVPGKLLQRKQADSKIPVNYLNYGPYGSFGPSYDTSLSNLTMDEIDILMQACKNPSQTDDLITAYYEGDDYNQRILNAIGGNDHKISETLETQSTSASHIQDQSKDSLRTEKQSACDLQINSSICSEEDANLDLPSLLTLGSIGIDVSFLNDMFKSKQPHLRGPRRTRSRMKRTSDIGEMVKCKLSQNAELIHTLKKSQERRLKTKDGNILSSEIKTAASITNNLKALMGVVTPMDVVSSKGLRKAIAINEIIMYMRQKGI